MKLVKLRSRDPGVCRLSYGCEDFVVQDGIFDVPEEIAAALLQHPEAWEKVEPEPKPRPYKKPAVNAEE